MRKQTSQNGTTAYLKALFDTIRDNYGSASLHIASTAVSFRLQGEDVRVQVETFQLVNLPERPHCYAWMHPTSESQSKPNCASVLVKEGITSPEDAVRSFLARNVSEQAA